MAEDGVTARAGRAGGAGRPVPSRCRTLPSRLVGGLLERVPSGPPCPAAFPATPRRRGALGGESLTAPCLENLLHTPWILRRKCGSLTWPVAWRSLCLHCVI